MGHWSWLTNNTSCKSHCLLIPYQVWKDSVMCFGFLTIK